MTLFFSRRPGFSDVTFRFYVQILRFFAVLNVVNVVYDPFFAKKHYFWNEFLDKTIFFTLFVLSRASDNTISLNIGGANAWAVPHLKCFGGTVPPARLGLCPWQPTKPPSNQPKHLLFSITKTQLISTHYHQTLQADQQHKQCSLYT